MQIKKPFVRELPVKLVESAICGFSPLFAKSARII
jgi:hypothetical protein